jgi:hypothetical protein
MKHEGSSRWPFVLVLLFSVSCAPRHAVSTAVQVKPVQGGWVDLVPRMELRIENAYYRDGMPKRGSAGYLGTETARFQVRPKGGLRFLSIQSALPQRPRDQLPVQELIRTSQRRYHNYRFFYAVVFNHRGNIHGSVLLGAKSQNEMDRLTERLAADPDFVCGSPSEHCTVFPEMCTVSIDIEIVVNGAPRAVLSGSQLSSVAPAARHVELLRLFGDRLTPVQIDPNDPAALRSPLLPGDQVEWDSLK